MKKLLTVLLAALMVFALVGCSKKEAAPTDDTPADDGKIISFDEKKHVSKFNTHYNKNSQ